MSNLLVTGTQRSGTTLLYSILSSIPEYHCINEMYDVHQKIHKPGSNETLDDLQQYLEMTTGISPFKKTKTRTEIFLASMNALAVKNNADYWCLKDPQITHFLSEYSESFDELKFIIIIRDPRAVVRSYLDKTTFRVGRPTNVIAASRQWSTEVDKQLAFAERHKDRCLVLKYEDVITNFEGSITAIGKFIGKSDRCRLMMEYHKNDLKGTPIHAGNENILRPPDPILMDRWKKKLRVNAISQIESIAKKTMLQIGYEPTQPYKKISSLRIHTAIATDVLRREVAWQRYKFQQRNLSTGK